MLEITIKYDATWAPAETLGLVIARCSLLKLTAQGATMLVAKRALDDVVKLFFDVIMEQGTFDSVMKDLDLVTTDAPPPKTLLLHLLEESSKDAYTSSVTIYMRHHVGEKAEA